MTALAVLLWGWVAAAFAATYTGDLCVDVDVDFNDLAGDRWIDNDVDRAARGVRVGVNAGGTTVTYHLSESEGCLRGLQVTTNTGQVIVAVYSDAIVSGVALESWSGPSDGDRDLESQVFVRNNVGANFSINLTVVRGVSAEEDAVWRNLLAATMVFKDQDWNIDSGPGRACCVPGAPGLDNDGTCGNSAYEYDPIAGPVQLQAYDFGVTGPGAQSRLVDSTGADDGAGVYSKLTHEKRVLAHELGHVILYHRAGGQEDVDANAEMDGCNGTLGLGGTPQDQAGYGFLTKEFASLAYKEGWADFVAVHTWNDPATAGCDLQNPGRDHDLNLNGTVSLAELGPGYRSAHPGYPDGFRTTQGVNVDSVDLIGVLDCDGDPDVEHMDPAFTWTPAFTIDGRNWLSDLIDANDAAGCEATADPDDESVNRTTRFDVVRMLWAMRTDQGLTPEQLSNLMVNTCFRTWDKNDATSLTVERLPWIRLTESAVWLPQEVEDALDAEADHVVH